jgi:hypothetical protein
MINKRNKAVLSCKLDNTAKRICKHQESIMPALNSMALHPISFSDFGERPAQRFSNVIVDSERVLSFDRDLSAFVINRRLAFQFHHTNESDRCALDGEVLRYG